MSVQRSGVNYADFSGGDLNFVIRGPRGTCECSPGCEHCYALAALERFGHVPARNAFYPDKLTRLRGARFEEGDTPFRRGPGTRPLLFPCDFGDICHPDVPTEFQLEALQVMIEREDGDWLLLTKRPFVLATLIHDHLGFKLPRHVWAGTTVCTQSEADRKGAVLAGLAERRWLSVEPMLEPISLFRNGNRVDWVVVGAESGSKRRAFDTNWARVIRDACRARAIPFFYKQGPGLRPGQARSLDGREWSEYPW